MTGIYPNGQTIQAVPTAAPAEHNIGAIIPSVKGRKIAYAIFAAVSFVTGNAVVFYSATGASAPVWLVGLSAVIANSAPAFSAIAIANASSAPKAS
jgi:hypothetical protein